MIVNNVKRIMRDLVKNPMLPRQINKSFSLVSGFVIWFEKQFNLLNQTVYTALLMFSKMFFRNYFYERNPVWKVLWAKWKYLTKILYNHILNERNVLKCDTFSLSLSLSLSFYHNNINYRCTLITNYMKWKKLRQD